MRSKQYRRKTVYKFLSKMYNLFRYRPDIFQLKKIKNCQGLCDYAEDTIFIDYRREFISTLIHECIHYIYPEYSETRVITEEKMVMNTITPRQVRNILKRFAQYL